MFMSSIWGEPLKAYVGDVFDDRWKIGRLSRRNRHLDEGRVHRVTHRTLIAHPRPLRIQLTWFAIDAIHLIGGHLFARGIHLHGDRQRLRSSGNNPGALAVTKSRFVVVRESPVERPALLFPVLAVAFVHGI